jgi:hypothetical protein
VEWSLKIPLSTKIRLVVTLLLLSQSACSAKFWGEITNRAELSVAGGMTAVTPPTSFFTDEVQEGLVEDEDGKPTSLTALETAKSSKIRGRTGMVKLGFGTGDMEPNEASANIIGNFSINFVYGQSIFAESEYDKTENSELVFKPLSAVHSGIELTVCPFSNWVIHFCLAGYAHRTSTFTFEEEKRPQTSYAFALPSSPDTMKLFDVWFPIGWSDHFRLIVGGHEMKYSNDKSAHGAGDLSYYAGLELYTD